MIDKNNQIEKSYDYIAAIFNKQKKIVPFYLCYGDGSIHGPLSKNEVKVIYDQIINYLTK